MTDNYIIWWLLSIVIHGNIIHIIFKITIMINNNYKYKNKKNKIRIN